MTFSTQSIGLDIAMGGGWIPGLHEVWGDTGSAKTTLLKHAAHSALKTGLDVLWIDLSQDVPYIDGVPRQMTVAWPRNAEDAFWVAIQACMDDAPFGLVCIDPAHLLTRQAELDGDPAFVPHPQREYASELLSLKRAALKSGTVVLFASKPRDKDRQPVRGTGISEKCTYRVHLHPDVVHQDGTRNIVATVKHVPSKVVKHHATEFVVRPGSGIDRAQELARIGVLYDVVIQRRSWFAWNNLNVHGINEFSRALRDNPALMRDLENDIRVIAGIA